VSLAIRAIDASNAHLLPEYLWLSIYVPPGEDAPPVEVLDRPDLALYVDGWGRYGDDGVLAIDTAIGRDVGAAWLRLWPGPETGYGYVDRSTPELAIAVRADYRGRGIGTCLLDALLDRAAGRHRAVSLSVSRENPAIALYQRLGFRVIAESGGSFTMRLTLPR
jgi:ribosomal protein S18 acetylase RimI-like enzyme